MTSRSKLFARLSAIMTALMLTVIGHTRAAHADEPECKDDWPNPNSCYPDILCAEYVDFWDVRRAIVHIYGPDIFGTGVLINNALCDDFGQDCGEPYLLTAYHVVSGAMGAEMSKWERIDIQNETMFTLGFEAAWCGGPPASGQSPSRAR